MNRLVDLATQIRPESSVNNNDELLVDFFKYQLSDIKNTGDWPDMHNKYKDHFVLSDFSICYTKIGNRMLDENQFRGTASTDYPNYNYGFYFERSAIGTETVGVYKECVRQVYDGGSRWSYHLQSDYTFDPDSTSCFVYFD